MPEPKRPLKVFLCHAHADRDAVRAIYTRLTNDGVDAWLDKEKLVAGQDWEYEIRKAVRESDVVVVCHSKQFNQKGFRQKEVKIALEEADLLPKGEIFIIPARLEECEVLDDLKRWHWVDLFEKDGYENLIRALRLRADRIGATLQIKRSWLPKITSPLTKKQKPVENKGAEIPEDKSLNTTADMPPPPEFPDGWDSERMLSAGSEQSKSEITEKANQEKIESEIQRKLEKSIKKAKRDLWWENLKIDIQYRLELLHIYRAPILFLLVGLFVVVPTAIYLSRNIPITSQLSNEPPVATFVQTEPIETPEQISTLITTLTPLVEISTTPSATFTQSTILELPVAPPTFSVTIKKNFQGLKVAPQEGTFYAQSLISGPLVFSSNDVLMAIGRYDNDWLLLQTSFGEEGTVFGWANSELLFETIESTDERFKLLPLTVTCYATDYRSGYLEIGGQNTDIDLKRYVVYIATYYYIDGNSNYLVQLNNGKESGWFNYEFLHCNYPVGKLPRWDN